MTPAWKIAIERSLKKNKMHMPYCKYVQLATVRPDGQPSCRTVVYRGFFGEAQNRPEAEQTEQLTFVTDSRSKKIEEVAKTPFAEVCWYFPGTREQFRIHGAIEIVGSSHTSADLLEARLAAWKKMSDAGRSQFAWPNPGLPRLEEDEALFNGPAPDAATPLDTFCLVVVSPSEVDHLSLKANVRINHVKNAEGQWISSDVNP